MRHTSKPLKRHPGKPGLASPRRRLQNRCGSHTFEDMRKDATITVRVPRPTRLRLETLARREGRSLSQQVERLIEGGLEREAARPTHQESATGPLAGLLAGEPVAEYGEFRSVRTLLSASLARRGRGRGTADR